MLPASATLRGKRTVSTQKTDLPEASGSDSPTSSTLLTIFVQKEKDKSVCDGDENSAPQGDPRVERRNRLKTHGRHFLHSLPNTGEG